jgi:hypothetical protein
MTDSVPIGYPPIDDGSLLFTVQVVASSSVLSQKLIYMLYYTILYNKSCLCFPIRLSTKSKVNIQCCSNHWELNSQALSRPRGLQTFFSIVSLSLSSPSSFSTTNYKCLLLWLSGTSQTRSIHPLFLYYSRY